MGGVDPAFDYSARALKKGKHVVTSNKELVATHGAELLELARQNNVNYLFEASVGGGIPILRPHDAVPVGQRGQRGVRHLKRHHQLYPHPA